MDNHEGQEAYSQRYKLSVGRLIAADSLTVPWRLTGLYK